MHLLASMLSSWLAWPTVAETVAGSILLLRLSSCERHLGSPKIAFFFVCSLALSLACAIAQRQFVSGVAANGVNGFGWGPSVVCGALLTRHLAEVPVRARFVVLGFAHVSDKAVEILLAIQVIVLHACFLGWRACAKSMCPTFCVPVLCESTKCVSVTPNTTPQTGTDCSVSPGNFHHHAFTGGSPRHRLHLPQMPSKHLSLSCNSRLRY